ncbi:MAG TPA: hypothetical protein VKS21_08310, partial [Spirochaetota bacterium]|nr:hypothetical protein [Spirochaetota bacterium]
MKQFSIKITLLLLTFIFTSCSNNPYKDEITASNVLLSAYSTKIKYVDPVRSYYSYETKVIDQIYESLFEYHYLKRPFKVIPNLAANLPQPVTKKISLQLYQGKNSPQLFKKQTVKAVSYTVNIKKRVFYAENKCFPPDPRTGKHTRELTAADFIYAFKRIADPRLLCPIAPVLSSRIYGMQSFYKYNKQKKKTDYSFPVAGLKQHGRYTLEILLKNPYPQLIYWL